MEDEFPVDPRYRRLEPTPEEIDAWADREHKRRQAWLAGPAEGERQDWARRYRRRAAFGLEESRLAPTPEEIEAWADREHKRRQAWLAGPTEEGKRDWARSRGRGAMAALGQPEPAPSPEEIDAWAGREGERRREWLAGPSEEEKRQWARREAAGFLGDWARLSPVEPLLSETAQRLLREAELAGKGSLYALSRAPAAIWTYFVRAGRVFEEESSREPRRSRVPY